MFIANETRGTQMPAFKFSALPSNSSVAASVTLLVCAWFAAAGGAILSDNHSGATLESARAIPAAYAPAAEIAPEARLTIVVEARRGAATL
jgi:hypothetical protein